MAKYDIFRFGTTYLGQTPQETPQKPVSNGGDIPKYNETSEISVGRTVSRKVISWIRPHGLNLFVADRCLLTNLCWEDLDRNDLTKGKPVIIDGQVFYCRLIRAGKIPEEPNEWDKILDVVGRNSDILHWKDVFTYGAESKLYEDGTITCVVRGGSKSGFWGYMRTIDWGTRAGFRPVLEPLGPDSETPNCRLDGIDFSLTNMPDSKEFCPILTPLSERAFASIPNGHQVRMYTLLHNGRPVRTDNNYKGKFQDIVQLELTDHYFGDEYLVPWTISNGAAVASRSLLE